jgi:hypothetical protein
VEPAVVLMVVAGFFKHSLPAMPAAALLFLLLEDWRRGWRASLVGAAAAGAGLLLCLMAYGPDFFADLMQPRVISVSQSLSSVWMLQWIFPALAIGAAWAWSERSQPAAKIFTFFTVAALLSFFLQRLGIGVDENAIFELNIAAAFGLGMGFARLPELWSGRRMTPDLIRWALLAVLVLRLLLFDRMEPYLLALNPAFRASMAEHSKVADAETKRIAAIPGKVFCSLGTVCRRAGKPNVVDRFKQQMLIDTGATSEAEFAARLKREGIRQEEVDWRVSIYSIDTKLPLFASAPR